MPLAGGTFDAIKSPNAGRPFPQSRGGKVIVLDGYKHDTNFLPVVVKAFRVNVGGTIKFTVYDGSASPGETPYLDITRAFAAGEIWDMAPVVKIWSTGTVTATGIDGVY